MGPASSAAHVKMGEWGGSAVPWIFEFEITDPGGNQGASVPPAGVQQQQQAQAPAQQQSAR